MNIEPGCHCCEHWRVVEVQTETSGLVGIRTCRSATSSLSRIATFPMELCPQFELDQGGDGYGEHSQGAEAPADDGGG